MTPLERLEPLAQVAIWGVLAYLTWQWFSRVPQPPRTWYAGIEGEGRGVGGARNPV